MKKKKKRENRSIYNFFFFLKSGHLLLFPSPLQLDLYPFFFCSYVYGMEEEKKNVLCALLLTDGVCCVEEKGGEEEGKEKKVHIKVWHGSQSQRESSLL
jgi:hypothetical protein